LPATAALIGFGCAKRDITCDGGAGLSPRDLQKRADIGYSDLAPKPDIECDNCAQYVGGDGDGCGTCKVMPGPTHPNGYCKLFQPTAG
jgi:hypothetical protein